MGSKIVVGNLKSYMTIKDVKSYLEIVNKKIDSSKVIICPSNIYIPYFLKQKYHVGLQTVSNFDLGAYTGEISAIQAKELGIRYAIVGHSERRMLLSETDSDINQKVKKCLDNKIKIILCIGETLKQRNENKTLTILKSELSKGLKGLAKDDLSKIVIAYEPIWAIGTNKIPTNDDIEKVSESIKKYIKTKFSFENIPVLYGGSVNEKNIKDINQIKNINGFLVGGASTKPKEFLKIIEVVVNQ